MKQSLHKQVKAKYDYQLELDRKNQNVAKNNDNSGDVNSSSFIAGSAKNVQTSLNPKDAQQQDFDNRANNFAQKEHDEKIKQLYFRQIDLYEKGEELLSPKGNNGEDIKFDVHGIKGQKIKKGEKERYEDDLYKFKATFEKATQERIPSAFISNPARTPSPKELAFSHSGEGQQARATWRERNVLALEPLSH